MVGVQQLQRNVNRLLVPLIAVPPLVAPLQYRRLAVAFSWRAFESGVKRPREGRGNAFALTEFDRRCDATAHVKCALTSQR
jgi:hypothetical protein